MRLRSGRLPRLSESAISVTRTEGRNGKGTSSKRSPHVDRRADESPPPAEPNGKKSRAETTRRRRARLATTSKAVTRQRFRTLIPSCWLLPRYRSNNEKSGSDGLFPRFSRIPNCDSVHRKGERMWNWLLRLWHRLEGYVKNPRPPHQPTHNPYQSSNLRGRHR